MDDIEVERHDVLVKDIKKLQKDLKTLHGGGGGSAVAAPPRERALPTRTLGRRRSTKFVNARGAPSSVLQNGMLEVREEAPDEDDDEQKLPEDIYSFLACTKYFIRGRPRAAFSLTMVVFMIQVLTLVLFSIDVIDLENPENPLGVPPGVENTVRFSQVIALLITAVSQDETQLSLNSFSRGYDTEATDKFRGRVTPFKWYFSILTRFLIGALSLAVTFMLIIRSDTVRDLMLDFTAVSFVSQIDDGIFLLSSWGYLGKVVRKEAEEIGTIPILNKEQEQSFRRRYIRIPRFLALTVILIGLIIAWMVLTVRQIQGEYVSKMVFVQFEDDFSPSLGTFSGLYQLDVGDFSRGGRGMHYVAHKTIVNSRFDARFSYCAKVKAWIFQIGEDPVTGEDLKDSNCQNSFIARSATTVSFDLQETTEGKWFYTDRTSKQNLPLTHFVVRQLDTYYGQLCSSDSDCGTGGLFYCELGGGGDDSANTGGYCGCLNDRFGVSCEFLKPCEEIEIDEQADPDGFVDTRPWSYHWSSVLKSDGTPYTAYFKPIYIGTNVRDGVYDVMVFAGRRWILINTAVMSDIPDGDLSPENVASFLSENFHLYWSAYEYAFRSSAVDAGTSSAAATPVEIQWSKIESLGTNGNEVSFRESKAILLCATCDDVLNPCFFNATCQPDRSCLCTTGSSGTLCQIPPVGDALCHNFFNNADNEYDGGDCCQTTCQSRAGVICGENITTAWNGLSEIDFTGYDHCADLDELCDPVDTDCWKVVYQSTGEIAFSELGLWVAVSHDGAVWALVEDASVMILEQYGSTYRQRGETFIRTEVASVSLSADGNTLAIATRSSGIDTFIWEARERRWKQMGRIFQEGSHVSSIALAFDGSICAVAYETGNMATVDNLDGRDIMVYTYSYATLSWQILGSKITDNAIFRERHVSLSGDGLTLAVGLYTSDVGAVANSMAGTTGVVSINASPEFNSTISPPSNSRLSDHVAIYEFDGVNWVLRGQMIGLEETMNGEFASFGRWVALSGSGDRIALMATVMVEQKPYRRVSAYEYSSEMNTWTTLGGIVQENLHVGEDAGPSLSMTHDGMVIAVGSIVESSISTATVSMYRYNESISNWTNLGSPINVGESTLGILPVVGLSGGGGYLSVGHEKQFGDVLLYRNAKQPQVQEKEVQNVTGLIALIFAFKLDKNPEQTGIMLRCNGSQPYGSLNPGSYYVPEASAEAIVYVEDGTDCEFAISDSDGDGMCCQQGEGQYEIYYGEKLEENLLASGGGFTFGSLERFSFTAANPSNLLPVTVELTYVRMRNFASQVALRLDCGSDLETSALAGALDGELDNEFVSEGILSKTFLLKNGTDCRFEITKKNLVDDGFGNMCESCTLGYEIYQGREGDTIANRRILAKQEPSAWAMSPTDAVEFTVSEEHVSRVPITVVIQPDSRYHETGYSLRCDGGLSVGFDIGFLAPVNASLPSDFVYQETFYIPDGSLCSLTVLDDSNDGLCCNFGKGYYKVFYGTNVEIDGSTLIHERDRFDSSETIFFYTALPSNDTSILTVTLQLDEYPDETGFTLHCGEELEVIADLDNYFASEHDRAGFKFVVQDASNCSLVVTDSAGNGIDGGYYEVLHEGGHLVFSNTFDGSSTSHDLSDPPLTASITVMVKLDTLVDLVSYEMRCAGYVRSGNITTDLTNSDDALLWTGSFEVLEGLNCQFALMDSGNNGIWSGVEGPGLYQVFYGELPDPTKLIASGSNFISTEIVNFYVSLPSVDDVLLGIRYQIPLNALVDPSFDLSCEKIHADISIFGRELGFMGGQVVTQMFILPADTGTCRFTYTDCCGDLVRVAYNSMVFAIVEKNTNVTASSGVFDFPPFSPEFFTPISVIIDATAYGLITFNSGLLKFDSIQFALNPGIQDVFIFTGIRTLTGTYLLQVGSLASVAAYDMFEVKVSIYYGSIYDEEDVYVPENLASTIENQTNAANYFYVEPDKFSGSKDVLVDFDFDLYPEECHAQLQCNNGYDLIYYMANLSAFALSRMSEGTFLLTFGNIPNQTDCTLGVYDQGWDGLQREGFEIRLGDVKEEHYDQGGYYSVHYNVSTGPPSEITYTGSTFSFP